MQSGSYFFPYQAKFVEKAIFAFGFLWELCEKSIDHICIWFTSGIYFVPLNCELDQRKPMGRLRCQDSTPLQSSPSHQREPTSHPVARASERHYLLPIETPTCPGSTCILTGLFPNYLLLKHPVTT